MITFVTNSSLVIWFDFFLVSEYEFVKPVVIPQVLGP